MTEISYTKETLPKDIDNFITHFKETTLVSFIPREGEENVIYTRIILTEEGDLIESDPRISLTPFKNARIKKIFYPNGIDIFFHSESIETIDTQILQSEIIKHLKEYDPSLEAEQENTYIFLNQIVLRVFGIPKNHCAVVLYSGIQKISEIITPEIVLDCARQTFLENFN